MPTIARKSTRVLFADLDGTVLEHATYSAAIAKPACAALQEAGIPVCFISSKTQAEMEHFRSLLGNTHPFVCENGGAVVLPGQQTIKLGKPRSELIRFLRNARRRGIPIRMFREMSVKETAEACGMPLRLAKLAQKRHFDEPFEISSDADKHFPRLRRLARKEGLVCTRGSRFYHLMGNTDKGNALRILAKAMRKHHGRVVPYAVGDSLNDAPMLQAARYSFLVQLSPNRYDKDVLRQVRGLRRVRGVGPKGFVEVAERLLKR